MLNLGFGCVPEDPLRMGAVASMSGLENMVLPDRRRYGRWMGRPHRYLAAGAYYHVATKGNNDTPIFRDDRDRAVFLQILRRVKRRYRWRLHARCLLGNHYHLLVETPLANLSDGMRDLNGQYARAFNERHRRRHHVFGQRFWSKVIESDRLHPQ